MRFEAHWNFSEISVEFIASLETSGIPVKFHRNSTDFFSRDMLNSSVYLTGFLPRCGEGRMDEQGRTRPKFCKN